MLSSCRSEISLSRGQIRNATSGLEMGNVKTLRTKLSKIVLDVVERRPQLDLGGWQELVEIRANQREQANEALLRASPPPGMTLQYRQLILVDIFDIQDHQTIVSAARRLFRDDPLREDDWLEGSLLQIQGGSSGLIGVIHSGRRDFLGIGSRAVIPKLPVDVDYIEVKFHKILPSFILLAYHIHLSTDFADSLASVLASAPLPEVTLYNLIPRKNRVSWCETGAETARQKAVAVHIRATQRSVELIVRKHFRGLLSQPKRRGEPQLPSLAYLATSAAPGGYWAYKSWTDANAYALANLSISLDLDGYFSSSGAFSVNSTRSLKPSDYSFISFQAPGTELPAGRQNRTVQYEMSGVLNTLAVRALVQQFAISVKGLRKAAYPSSTGLLRRLTNERFVGGILKFCRAVQRLDDRLLRLEAELTENEFLWRRQLSGVRRYVAFGIVQERRRTAALSDDLWSMTLWDISAVKVHATRLRSFLQDLVASANVLVTYRLQVVVIVLTFATIVVAVGAGWSSFKDFFADLRHLLHR